MGLMRWEPFREFEDIQARLNRLFGGSLHPAADQSFMFTDWAPAADIEETEKEYVVKADLPEVKKEDVKVTVDEGVLNVHLPKSSHGRPKIIEVKVN